MKNIEVGSIGLLLLAACSTPATRLATGPGIPAAEGTVKAEKTDSGNTRVELKVERMATPDKIEPGTNTFVVWARPHAGGNAENLGALRVNSDLKGKMQTTTSLHDFHLFLTAEASQTTTTPTGRELMWTDIVS